MEINTIFFVPYRDLNKKEKDFILENNNFLPNIPVTFYENVNYLRNKTKNYEILTEDILKLKLKDWRTYFFDKQKKTELHQVKTDLRQACLNFEAAANHSWSSLYYPFLSWDQALWEKIYKPILLEKK